jgi:tRNA/rRNA methyltransferase
MNQRLSLTLVGSEYPVNVGYTARLMKNFGVSKLFLVEPRIDLRIASVYASHGHDLIENAEIVGFEEVRKRHELLIATTAVRAKRKGNVIRTTVRPEEVVNYVAGSESVSLVFGRDTTGLRNDEIEKCDIVTSLDTGTEYRTLNLSHAAAILLYLISKSKAHRRTIQSFSTRKMLARYAYELAVECGLQEHRAKKLKEITKRIALKSELTDREITSFLSLLRKASQALKSRDGAIQNLS